MKNTVLIFLGLFLSFSLVAQQKNFSTDVFLYGASVYPEVQTKDEQIRMLDLFSRAGFTVLRLGESAWGNLETGPGKFNFGWLRDFLDEMQKRRMKAILGTCSYIPPQWLAAAHPEILMQYSDGSKANPMGRHAECRNHPVFREELKKFILAYAAEFKDHPAVIGWQLDNEIEQNIGRIDYNDASKKAWTSWLTKTYANADSLNNRLGLRAWGLEVPEIADVPLPSRSNDGSLPILSLAALHFDRDNIIEYLDWQKSLLREAGVKQWITTDWIMTSHTIADEPALKNILGISGINEYQPTENDSNYWAWQSMFNDIHRSQNPDGHFLVTETRIGPTGSEKIWTPSASHRQFITWIIQPAAFGACGVLHWSGNRFTGGHWPHWGGMLDWSGNPEPDFKWTMELSSFFKKWGNALLTTSVDARAAVLTDFDNRAALEVYPHTSSSAGILTEAFDAFHRNGIGVDAISTARAASYDALKKYRVIIIAAASCLDGKLVNAALRKFVENGGTLIVTPFTGYQTWDGIFHDTGFGSSIENLTGTLTRTVRLLPGAGNDSKEPVWVVWDHNMKIDSSRAGIDGFSEILELQKNVQVIARFSTNEDVMNGRPAATINKTGAGTVVKLAYWPAGDGFAAILRKLTPEMSLVLKDCLPAGVEAVPRTDGSCFIINTLDHPVRIFLKKRMTDRITGERYSDVADLKPYAAVWLE
jgi:beta-galactosidase